MYDVCCTCILYVYIVRVSLKKDYIINVQSRFSKYSIQFHIEINKYILQYIGSVFISY